MNWDAAGAIGEILGAIFVFGSLIYLGVQIRHSSRSTLSQSINTKANQLQSLAALQANPDLMLAMQSIYVDSDAKPSFKDAALLEAYFIAGLAFAQAEYEHHERGLDSSWESSRRMIASYFATDYARVWWKGQGRVIFGADFAAEIDAIISEGYEGDFWTNYERSEDT